MNNEDFQIKEIEPKKADLTSSPRGLALSKILRPMIIFVIIGLILIAGIIFVLNRHPFSQAKVRIDLKTPENIPSGEEVVLTIVYKNDNSINLNDAYLVIDYAPGTFSPEGKEIYQEQRKIGTIPRKSQGEEGFKVRFTGPKGTVKNLSVKLNYQPQNISSRFENSASFRVEINSVLIGIKIDGPEKSISGQEVNYLIKYENKTDSDISDLRIELTYSGDFEFKSAVPKPMEGSNNIWQVNFLEAGKSQTINLQGTLKGEEGEEKILETVIGRVENDIFLQYSQLEYITQIAPSPLLILLEIERMEEECNIDVGQRLDYKIEFRNNTDVALEELILKAHFQDSIFDFKTLNLGKVGFFDSRENVITWSGAEVLALNLLEPGQTGEVKFSIQIRKPLPIFSYDDKNFQARVLAEIETLTVPAKFSVPKLEVSEELACKVNSQLDLKSKVYYYEPGIGILNTGPLPPKVDQLTTYTVHWQIINTSNDIENVRVWTALPQGINWTDYYINKVQNSRFYYNERTKEVVWEINKVPAGTGVILPVYELVFQIGLRPSIIQVGQTPNLINESSIEGKDTFTENTLKNFSPEVNTSLPDDSRVGHNEARVVE